MTIARIGDSRLARISVAVAAATLLLAAPSLAFADHGRRGHGPRVYHHGPTCDSHGGRHGYHRGHGRHHGYDRGHGRHHGRGYYGHAQYRSDRYYCSPCGSYFKNRHGFHSHLNRHHHIPLWKLPFVIVHSTIGWVFHGGHGHHY